MLLISVSERCAMASEKPPQEWPEEVLWPLHKEPVSIFGYSQTAMARNLTKPLVDAIVDCGLSQSKGQARTSIKNNAVMINRVKCNDVSRVLTEADALPNLDAIVIENGKYNFGIIEMCEALEQPNEKAEPLPPEASVADKTTL